jgi:hypothetical protein
MRYSNDDVVNKKFSYPARRAWHALHDGLVSLPGNLAINIEPSSFPTDTTSIPQSTYSDKGFKASVRRDHSTAREAVMTNYDVTDPESPATSVLKSYP